MEVTQMDQNTNPQQQYQPQQQQYQPQQQQYQPQQQQYQPQQQQYQSQQYQQTAKLKGSTLVKVVGILMTIFGPLGIIASIYSFTTIRALLAFSDGLFSMFDEFGGSSAIYGAAGLSPGLLYASIALSAVGSIMLLIAGIMGIKNHNNKEKAGTLVILGIAIIAINVLSSVLAGIGGNFSATSIVGLLLGAVIPVLYIIGATQNKKS